MKRRASTVHRRGPGRRRAASAPALVSRDAFCVLSGVSERELAMWEQEALVAPARVVMLDGRREPLYASETLSTCSTRCIAERVGPRCAARRQAWSL